MRRGVSLPRINGFAIDQSGLRGRSAVQLFAKRHVTEIRDRKADSKNDRTMENCDPRNGRFIGMPIRRFSTPK